ncbi:MAG: restriction endonuclease subunit S [Chloroflexi bacterium]|nr:restriction endonuclease subunit S [Chloroflexota bacterium]
MIQTGSEQWPAKRLRFVTQRRLSEAQRRLLSQASQVTFVPMEAVGERGELDISAVREIEEVRTGYTQFFEGDVLVAKITPCFENGKGALVKGISGGVGFGTTELHVLTPTSELEGPFLYYVTVSAEFRGLGEAHMTGAAGQKRVPEDFVRDYRVSIPPLPLQRMIAHFLDRETARIDALLAAKQRLLDLLAEKRQALITRAVTRGLDPYAPLRDSGIPWLRRIPAHWEIWKLGHTASIGNGCTPSRDNADYWVGGTIPWLNSSVVNQNEVTEADQFVTTVALRECHLPLVRRGSVLLAITGQGKTRGQATVVSFDATINQHLAFISPNDSRLDPWYLRWTLLAAYDFLRSVSDGAGGTKGALTCEDVTNLRVPVPAIDEQRAIVQNIAAEAAGFKALRSATERTVGLLKERRAALIAAAVTGKIVVQEAVA